MNTTSFVLQYDVCKLMQYCVDPQMIPGLQMIPDRKWSRSKNKERHGWWNNVDAELAWIAIIIKTILKWLQLPSFSYFRLKFVTNYDIGIAPIKYQNGLGLQPGNLILWQLYSYVKILFDNASYASKNRLLFPRNIKCRSFCMALRGKFKVPFS